MHHSHVGFVFKEKKKPDSWVPPGITESQHLDLEPIQKIHYLNDPPCVYFTL